MRTFILTDFLFRGNALENTAEILPGVYQLKMPIPDNPLGFINSYLIKSAAGCLLIDTGWNTDEAFAELNRQLDEIGISF